MEDRLPFWRNQDTGPHPSRTVSVRFYLPVLPVHLSVRSSVRNGRIKLTGSENR